MPDAALILPGHEAAARNQQIALANLRLQVAASVVGQLLPQQLAAQAQRAKKEAGIGFEGGDVPQVNFDAGEPGGAIDSATNIAIATADTLLSKLGFQA